MMNIRPEVPGDADAIREVVSEAFAAASHSDGTEPLIVDALRSAQALTISLVAVEDGVIVGHVAVSPVAAESGAQGWFGLGPVSVHPDWQGRGIGKALIGEALERLRRSSAAGCVVVGEPDYYGRFGFEHDPAAHYRDIPPPYLQMLSFRGPRLRGAVEYHPAFDVTN